MNSFAVSTLTPEQVAWLERLARHNATSGSRASLPDDTRATLRDYAAEVLVDQALRLAHTHWLERHYRGRYPLPVPPLLLVGDAPRLAPAVGFPRGNRLAPVVVQRLAESGLDELGDDVVAEVLLNPAALWEAADAVESRRAECWLDRLDAAGTAALLRHGLVIQVPELPEGDQTAVLEEATAVLEEATGEALLAVARHGRGIRAEGEGVWSLSFAPEYAALERRLREQAYGDPEQAMALRLFLQGRNQATDPVTFQLAMSPPPERDVSVGVVFPGGHSRTFLIQKPFGQPTETRSVPCVPLPPEVVPVRAVAWRDVDGIVTLELAAT